MDKRTCTIEGCDREQYARTWCQAHYWRWMRNGTPGSGPIQSRQTKLKRTCSEADCSVSVLAKGLCRRHYNRLSIEHMEAGACIVDGCGKAKASRKGLCKSHLRYVGMYGTTCEAVALLERLASGAIEDESGCWVWQRAASARGTGYPIFSGGYAHRVAWEAYRGEIPDGLEVDHLCRNSRCINPYHLEPVTRDENLRRRALTPGEHLALIYA